MSATSKIALITGGSRGLGKNMALRLAEAGHDVIITYHTKKDEADAVVKTIEEGKQKAIAMQFDVGDIQSIGSFLQQLSQILKTRWATNKFDFLINNAGIGATIPFSQVTENDFDRFSNIHFKGVYFLTQKSLPMINDRGRIINISSGTTRRCVTGYSVYASMKGAIETFTKYIAKETGPRGITANVLAPGAIETDFNDAGLRSSPERKAYMASITALGRTGKPEDIGGIVAFLCSEDAGWINGQCIEASGGMN